MSELRNLSLPQPDDFKAMEPIEALHSIIRWCDDPIVGPRLSLLAIKAIAQKTIETSDERTSHPKGDDIPNSNPKDSQL